MSAIPFLLLPVWVKLQQFCQRAKESLQCHFIAVDKDLLPAWSRPLEYMEEA